MGPLEDPYGALLSFAWFPTADPSPHIKGCLLFHTVLKTTSWQLRQKNPQGPSVYHSLQHKCGQIPSTLP